MGAHYGQTSDNIEGRAYPPQQSRHQRARMQLRADIVQLFGDDGALLTTCPRAEVAFDAPIGSAARRVTLPDGTLFETDDHAAVEEAFGKAATSILHKLEQLHPRMIGFVAVAVFAVWVIWRYGLDIMASAALAMTPPQMIDAVDAGTLQTIDLTFAEPSISTADQQARANAIFDTLLATLDADTRATHDFQLEFRNMPGLGPNALALPGGTVILTDELIRLFPSQDVQAGVLAHEIGHIVEQHGMKQLYRSLGIAVLVTLMAGDTVAIVEEIVLEGNLLLSLNFSRESEREADEFGVTLASEAGYDPAGLVTFFEWIIAEMGDTSSWLSTHPSSAERVERLQELIDAQ